ncbi:MAG: hypothetical protein H6865_07295 [Rhodospirillales bacterium]|nr:hypothetical protein [Alphaproteobacteria bacterium]MCB9987421.1 hypothetical protein [Rhodospirillales bacterium]USO07597.1 MAG: hypothetical protein H6866_09360 [Rhodospirillales bacterium]
MAGLIHIWCDGSYRDRHDTMGAGWVRTNTENDPHARRVKGSRTVRDYMPNVGNGSDTAELLAFALALEDAPRGSSVCVHMDCTNVMEWLQAGTVSGSNKRGDEDLMRAFNRAARAKTGVGHVTYIYTRDKSSPNMGLAHTLARAASTPPNKKKTRAASSHGGRHAHQNSQRPARARHP